MVSFTALNMIAMIGTSDRLCWLAEFCQFFLLLLLQLLRFELVTFGVLVVHILTVDDFHPQLAFAIPRAVLRSPQSLRYVWWHGCRAHT